jgi:hypothetical protein
MTLKLGVVMDPIATITIKKDTTFAMLLAAQARNWELHYFEQADLYARGNQKRSVDPGGCGSRMTSAAGLLSTTSANCRWRNWT